MFSSDTEIITDKGAKPLSYFRDKEAVQVVGADGLWVPAKIYHVGRRKVQRVFLSRDKPKSSFLATPDHRWLLDNGKGMEDIEPGDRMMKPPDISWFDFPHVSRFEKQFWCMGFVYRNGNKLKDGSCVTVIEDRHHHERKFKQAGYMAKRSPLFEKEWNCYIEGYHRQRIEPGPIPVMAVRAFVNGYLDAFSHEKEKIFRNPDGSMNHRYFYVFPHDYTFIREMLPMAGFYIATESPQGKRTKMNLWMTDKTHPIKVAKIEPFGMVKVSRVEVDSEDYSFTLPWGLVSRDL